MQQKLIPVQPISSPMIGLRKLEFQDCVIQAIYPTRNASGIRSSK